MVKADITIFPEKEVYYPGEVVRVKFKLEDLKNVERVKIGFKGEESLRIVIWRSRSSVSDKARRTLIDLSYDYDCTGLSEFIREYEFKIPVSVPPSVELSDRVSSSRLEVHYYFYVKAVRKFRPDYYLAREIIVGSNSPTRKVEPLKFTVNNSNISFYAELQENRVKPGDTVELKLTAYKMHGIKKVVVNLESYAWLLASKYGRKIVASSFKLLELKPEEIPSHGKTVKIKIPRNVPPTIRREKWWTWTELGIAFHSLLRKVCEVRRELNIEYRYHRTKLDILEEPIICQWCGKPNPRDLKFCQYCHRNLT